MLEERACIGVEEHGNKPGAVDGSADHDLLKGEAYWSLVSFRDAQSDFRVDISQWLGEPSFVFCI